MTLPDSDSLALGLLADVLITSPTLTLVQGLLTRRLMNSIYADLSNSRMDYHHYYTSGSGKWHCTRQPEERP